MRNEAELMEFDPDPDRAIDEPDSSAPQARVRGFVLPLDTVRIPVVVDHRESRSGLPDRLRELGLAVQVRELDVGDVVIGNQIVVERKTSSDLLSSLNSGRLFKQAYRLRACSRPLLVVEGDPWELIDSDQATAARGALLTLLTGYRIPIAQTCSLAETAACLVHLAMQAERRERRRNQSRPATSRERQALTILEALPEVGPARARALYRVFGSVAALAASDVETLARVPGIGRVLATRLVAALNGGERKVG